MTHIITTDNTDYHERALWLDENTCVSQVYINDLVMRIGSIGVRMAGIGGVETNREYRKKGYMRTLIEDSVTYMMDQGYCVSALFGIENFYNKWGYVPALADYTTHVKTRDAETAKNLAKGYEARTVIPKDMPAIVHLYNQCNAMRSGSIVRSPDRFKEFLQGSDWGTEIISYLWENNEGKLLAYAVMDNDSTAVRVNEIEAVDDSLFATALYFFVMQAVEKRCESIHMKLPVDHPFVEFTQRYGAEWVVTFERYGNGMMRIINQQALFGALIPELERRLAITNFHNYTGALTLETDLGTTHLIIEGGTVRLEEKGLERIKLSLSQQYLIQLLIGYRSVRDVVNDPAVQIRGDAIPLLNALFPKGTPYMYFADHF